MTEVSVDEIKRDVLTFLHRVEAGETLVVLQAGKPLAEVRPLTTATNGLRPFGLCSGEFVVPDDFDNPLPVVTVVAVKVAVRYRNTILVIREPEWHEWMPGRLGLPGGKTQPGESLQECLKRKLQTEVGVPVRDMRLHCIYNILMPDKVVLMFIYVAETDTDQVGEIEGTDPQWLGLPDLAGLGKDEFTEYYNDELIRELLSGEVATAVLRTQDNRRPEIKAWMDRARAEEPDSNEDISPFEPHKVYYLPTPYNSFGAAEMLMKAMAAADSENGNN